MLCVKKKIVIFCLWMVIISLLLCGCDVYSFGRQTVGKANTTIQKIVPELQTIMEKKGYKDQRLYGVYMTLNDEKIGDVMLAYADKMPQEISYRDILLVHIDSRTGDIKSMGEPSYSEYGSTPYDFVSGAGPIDVSEWKYDSDAAITAAASAFTTENGFDYNYIWVKAFSEGGVEMYEITFISLIQHMQYVCKIDAYTGSVLSQKTIED